MQRTAEPHHIARQRYVTHRWLRARQKLESLGLPVPSYAEQLEIMRALAEHYDRTWPEQNSCAPANKP